MNNKAINEFGFCSIHRIKQIEEDVIHRSQNRLKHIWRNKITEIGSLYSYSHWRRVEVFVSFLKLDFSFSLIIIIVLFYISK